MPSRKTISAAETLLKKAIDKDPRTIRRGSISGLYSIAWAALTTLSTPTGSRRRQARCVRDEPELGIDAGPHQQPRGERYLRAATTLKPTAHVEEGQPAPVWHSRTCWRIQIGRRAAGLPQSLRAHAEGSRTASLRRSAARTAKRFSDAEAEYKQVLGSIRTAQKPAIGLTNIYMKSGRLGDAEPLLRRLAAERPNDAGIHLQLGRVSAAQSKKDDAIAEIQTALNLAPAIPTRSAISPTCWCNPTNSRTLKKSIATCFQRILMTPTFMNFSARRCSKNVSFRTLSRNS